MNIEGFGPGWDAPPTKILNEGEEGGKAWVPAETDVSIRPGWFYSPSTDDKVKSLAKLVDIYYTSVGRNSNLLLNVPPDKRGLIHPVDSARLIELRKVIDESFAVNLARKAKFKANHTRASKYAAKNLGDGKYDSYWTTDDNQLSASIEVDLGSKKTFNRVLIQEYIPLGQRVKAFSIEYWDGTEWKFVDRQTTIGYKRILRFPAIEAQKVRINIEESLACPVLNAIEIYNAPELLSPVEITRNKQGIVTIFCESKDPVIYYTLDGTLITPESERYTTPFPLPEGGTVMAKAYINNNTQSSETARRDFDIAPAKWSVVSPLGRGVDRAIDGNPNTVCVLPEGQNSITIDLGEDLMLHGFSYYPVYNSAGNINRYNFYTSLDSKKWDKHKDNVIFDNIKNNPVPHYIRFVDYKKARYIRLESLETVEPGRRVTIGEIGVITK